jgi:hypothetical protein
MDKLEQYLDQVCRSVGGPRSLRQHVRQELREHLLDAVAEHKAAGMSEEKALDRALEDFGGPEQVRSELEATHGQRLLPVVIDKAMQWKEKTMKAKWLWTTWAHLVLVGVVAMEVTSITFATVFLAPRLKKILREGWLEVDMKEPVFSWIPSFLHGLDWVGSNLVWLLLTVAVLWALFEWRVRSENKSFMRLAALGTAALVLVVLVAVLGWALVVPPMAGLPGMDARVPEKTVIDREARIESSVGALEDALAQRDWEAIQEHANQASSEMESLAHMGAAAPALTSMREQAKVDELRLQLKAARDSLQEARQASWAKDPAKLEAALKKFHEVYAQVQATTKPDKR